MDEGKQTFVELLAGIGIISVIFLAPGLLFRGEYLSYYLGLALGLVIAIIYVFDMYRSISNCIEMEEKHAQGYAKRKALFRLLIAIVAFVVAAFVPGINIIGTLLGTLTLKFSAYIQPLTHKILKKINKGR